MRRIWLILLLVPALAYAQSNPGVIVKGTVTPNDCANFVNGWTIQDSGGTCGGSGSLAITATSANVTFYPLFATSTSASATTVFINSGTTINPSTNTVTTGILTLGTPLAYGSGGTGQTSYTNLGVVYAGTSSLTSTSTLANAVLATSSTGVPFVTNTLPSTVQSNITSLGAVTTGSLSLMGTTTLGTLVVSSCTGCGGGSSNLGTSIAATSPSISGDATSGFYTPGTSQVAVSAGGTKIEQWAPTSITLNEPTTIGSSLTLSANNFITDTTTGTKIGTLSTQKLGFFGATPVAQQSGDVVTALNSLGLDTSGTVALATSATNSVNVGITDDNSTNAAMNIAWVTSNTGNLPVKTSSNVLNFNPASGAITVTSGNAKTSFTSAGVTSGTSFAASATTGLALDATSVTTGTAVSATGLTSGIGLGITGGATAIGYQFTSSNATSSTAKAINIIGTQSMTADYTGEYVICAPIKTMTPAATRNISGTGLCFFSNPSYTITGSAASIMNASGASNAFTRTVSNTSISASSSLNLSGPVATFTNPSPTRTHPVVDTATVVTITQNDASGTGVTLDVENASSSASAIINGPADGITITGASTANPATVTIAASGSDTNVNLNLTSKGSGTIECNGNPCAVYQMSFQPGLVASVTNTKSVFSTVSAKTTVVNLSGSASAFSCVSNPTITMYECGTDASCATSPTTIGSVTVTAAGTGTAGTISSPTITAGDWVAFAISAGTCTSLDISATAQVYQN